MPVQGDAAGKNTFQVTNRVITPTADIGFVPFLEGPTSLSETHSEIDTPESNRASGYALTQIGYNSPVFRFLLLDSNNSLISGGYWTTLNSDFYIKRNLLSGAIDSTFNTTGAVSVSISTGADVGYGAVLQTDGKVAALGSVSSDFSVVRYSTDGMLDTTFRTSGKALSSISTGADVGYGAVLQTDGKVVAVGYGSGTNTDFALARFITDGQLDTTFQTSGKLLSSISTGNDNAHGTILQTDGKVVAAGAGSGTDADFALARYTTDGLLDTSFFTSGKLLSSISTGSDYAYGAILQTDGKVVAHGKASVFALARYTTDGQLDTTFKTSGKVTSGLSGGADAAYGALLQTDGKIVAAGLAGGSFYHFALARYLTDGKLDTSFSTSGTSIAAITTVHDAIYGAVLLPDGRIAASGTAISLSPVVYTTDGRLDTSFQTNAKPFNTFGSTSTARAIVIDGAFRPLVVGFGTGQNSDFALARYLRNGKLDTTFQTSGRMLSSISTGIDQAYGAFLQTDGKVIVSGYGSGGNNDFALARYTTDGQLDTTFKTSGKLLSSNGTGADAVYGAVLQTDSKLVAIGQASGSDTDFALARYTTDGLLDTSFFTSGKLLSSISTGADAPYGAVLQTDGKVIAAGYGTGTDVDFALARYTTDGLLDTSFFTSGKLLSSISTGGDIAYAAVLQKDGKVIAAGYGNGTNLDFALARYTTDGLLDTSFFTSGKILTSVGGSTDIAYGVALQANGKIFAVGYSTVSGNNSYSVARYLTNGRLDTSFKTTGKFTGSIRGQGDNFYALKIDPSTGYLYAAGSSTRAVDGDVKNSGTLFLLMRIAP